MAATLSLLRARSTGAAARAPSHARRTALNCAPRGVARQQRLRVACDASKQPSGVLDSVKTGVDRFLARYDLLSTGLGALCVTGYCVARGQEPSVAASITVTATITALVLNELLFTDNGGSGSGSSDK